MKDVGIKNMHFLTGRLLLIFSQIFLHLQEGNKNTSNDITPSILLWFMLITGMVAYDKEVENINLRRVYHHKILHVQYGSYDFIAANKGHSRWSTCHYFLLSSLKNDYLRSLSIICLYVLYHFSFRVIASLSYTVMYMLIMK